MTRLSSRSVRCAGAAIAQHATRAVTGVRAGRTARYRLERDPARRALSHGRPRRGDMIQWREGRVTGCAAWEGAVELDVDVAAPPGRPAASCRALAYPALVGEPRVGELVLLNTTALEAGLGTGGYAFVVAIPHRLPVDPPLGPGTSSRRGTRRSRSMVLGVDEQGSPHHELLRDADDLLEHARRGRRPALLAAGGAGRRPLGAAGRRGSPTS